MSAGLLAVGLCCTAAGASNVSGKAAFSHGPEWQGMRTVTYCTDGGVPLAMSLFAPSASPRPVPVVVEIHGGGWQQGSRLLSLASSTTAADLVAAGIMVASVDYRLAPRDPWPDQIIDVECAVRFLRAHAADLGIEPDRIAALGTSAGGQLASLLGMAAVAHEWDQGPYLDQSSRVDVVVDQFGPADLTATDWPHDTAVMIRRVFGAYPTPANPVLKAASPVTYAAAADAPFLIVQGTDDQVVPLSQSEELASRLRAAGVPVQLVLVARGRHGLVTPGESPSPAAISTLITAYLSRALRH